MESGSDSQLVNPCLVVTVSDQLFAVHDTTFAKEDWVKANDILMQQDGVKNWLEALLDTLANEFRDSLATPLNPYHAVILSRPLNVGIETITSQDWVTQNTELIAEFGNSRWLWALITVFEQGQTSKQL